MTRPRLLTAAVFCLLMWGVRFACAQEVVLNWSIAYSGTSPGQVGWSLEHGGGWPGFIKRHVEPALEWCEESGVEPAILIHHPWGQWHQPGDTAMCIDAIDHAKKAKAAWLTNDFATQRGWKRITGKVPCYGYFGGAEYTERIKQLPTAERAALIARNIKPLADAGFRGVFIDAAEMAIYQPFKGANAKHDAKPSCDLLTLAIADDMFPERTGVEAAPRAFPEFRHLWDRPVVAQDKLWRHRFGGLTPEQQKAFGYGERHKEFKAFGYDRSVLTGKVWRTVAWEQDAAKMAELSRLIVAEGDVPAVSPLPFIAAGVKASELVEGAE